MEMEETGCFDELTPKGDGGWMCTHMCSGHVKRLLVSCGDSLHAAHTSRISG